MSKKSILGKKVANKVREQIKELLAEDSTEISDALQVFTKYNEDTNSVECALHIGIGHSWTYDLNEQRKSDELLFMVLTAKEKITNLMRRLTGE